MDIKERNKFRLSKSQFLIIGSFLIIIGICSICGKYVYNYFLNRVESNKIEQFYQQQENMEEDNILIEEDVEEPIEDDNSKSNAKEDYIAVIKIPKINLEKGLCAKNSSCNNVNKNIQILDDADYPNIKNGNFILAGHSGSGKYAYFKNAYKLTRGDEISITYNGYEYKYKIMNIYDVEKTGMASIIRNREKNTLTIITCRQKTNKQIIVISELIERTKYNDKI